MIRLLWKLTKGCKIFFTILLFQRKILREIRVYFLKIKFIFYECFNFIFFFCRKPKHVVVKWWKKVLNSCYTRILKEKNFFFFQSIVFPIYFHNPFPPGWPGWSFIYEKWFKIVHFLLILQELFSIVNTKMLIKMDLYST